MQKVNQAYVQAKFTTAGQGEILLLLYDGAIKFLIQAKEKMQAKDYVSKGNLISKALDIVNELDASLNKEAGGDLAQNLHQLYFLCSTKLLQANLRMKPELIDAVMDILSGLRSAYAQILTKPEAQAAASLIASKQSLSGGTATRTAPLPPIPGFSTGIGRGHAQAAYGQQHTAFGLPGSVPFGTREAAPIPVATPTMQAPAPASPPVAPEPASPPVAPEPVAPEPVAPEPVAPEPALFTPTAAQTSLHPALPGSAVSTPVQETPANQPALPLNLGSRRLAATAKYGKMAGI